MELIYCGNGNRRFGEIAINAGFLYGAQLPGTVYHSLHFADQNWKKPNRTAYMNALAQHKPNMASVLDLERDDQLSDVLSWAEEAAQYVQTVMIIPKAFGIVPHIPERICGADVRLGYSVPTKFGGTEVPVWEFGRRPVHLLGGNPGAQKALTNYLNVASVDGNMSMKIATRHCKYYDNGAWISVGVYEKDAPYEAFRRSCENIMKMWGN